MASVAVLPVVIGLGVDYAIQLQARFREAAAAGHRPPAAAVTAALRGGPVIGTAAVATSVGFLSLTLSPIPMVREFAIALVAGIAAALLISLSAGLAALSMTAEDGTRRRGLGARIASRVGSAARVKPGARSPERRQESVRGGGRRGSSPSPAGVGRSPPRSNIRDGSWRWRPCSP